MFTAVVNIVFGLQYAAVTTVAAGLLQMIPFFGPFVSWAPPVLIAMLMPERARPAGRDPDGHRLVRDDEHPPAAAHVRAPWASTRSWSWARSSSGSKVAGIAGAIFGIPIAAVMSALFFHWVARSRENGAVADRAAKRVAAREGRAIRRPREPIPGVDVDVDEVLAARGPQAHPEPALVDR